jgi:malate synthase
MLEISNQNLYQWIKRNGGFKSESINSMEMRSLI